MSSPLPLLPITADQAAGSLISFQDLVLDHNQIYWSESRPLENGRNVILCYANGETTEILPAPFNARSRVHEYGGAAFTIKNGIIYFVNDKDQRLYKIIPQGTPEVITQPGIRFADLQWTPNGIICIAESHQNPHQPPENFLALINITTGEITTLAQGNDFYSSPALSADYKKIAWITWNHPNMPWDNTQLWIADLHEAGLTNSMQIDANYTEQSFFQPQWDPNTNNLVVASDKSNWWNLYQVLGTELVPLFTVESEIGLPLWQFGMSTWGFYDGGILCAFKEEASAKLFLFKNGTLNAFPLPVNFTVISQLKTNTSTFAFFAGSPDKPTQLIAHINHQLKNIHNNFQGEFALPQLSIPQKISFNTDHGQVYAYYYPPIGNAKLPPPLLVKIHGGPTAQCDLSLRLDIQFWTTRGFAVVDVDYTGSTGYGREYRHRINGFGGIYDIQDCENASQCLIKKGLADKNKIAIMGSSAGGYAALAAITFTETFKVGAILYGIGDLALLAQETHKFEAHYLDTLVGPYPAQRAKYEARSPIYHLNKINVPIIFFHGNEDKIVPPQQTEMMFKALQDKGIQSELCIFAGEQHGFRKAENKVTVLEKQYAFFSRILFGDS